MGTAHALCAFVCSVCVSNEANVSPETHKLGVLQFSLTLGASCTRIVGYKSNMFVCIYFEYVKQYSRVVFDYLSLENLHAC